MLCRQGHHVYSGQLASLHSISIRDASCSSSVLSTACRDVLAFPLGKQEPSASRGLRLSLLPFSNQTAIFCFPCPVYLLSSTSPLSSSLCIFLCFSFSSQISWVPALDTKSIPWDFASNWMQLWGYCITDLGMPSGLLVLQGTEKLRLFFFTDTWNI